jgi:hypothetical protein
VKPYSELIEEKSDEQTSTNYLHEMNQLAAQVFHLWYPYMDLMMAARKPLITILTSDFHKSTKERWGEAMFQELYCVQDWIQSYESKVGENHKQIATSRRNNMFYRPTIP